MATANVYNLQGKQAGEMTLDDAVFGVQIKPDVVQFVMNAQVANAAQSTAHSKERGEVRGGGKKPWRQKGTGRARHGSSRSPLWVGGAVTFGPRNDRNQSKKVNKKTRRSAIRMVLTDKLANTQFVIVDSFDGIEGKTKQFAAALEALPVERQSALVLTAEKNDALRRAAQNVQGVNTAMADSVNVRDLLKYQYVIVDQAGAEKLVATFN